ncbi:MAG: DUF3854 domain-containing protein [Actinomycetota bacterium]|nr:DUF3854 domain-containing protein [Actinomycetota bacterium]
MREKHHLSDGHKKMLEESGIALDVVEARGYETVTTKAELGRLGFTKAQQSCPALKIPVYGPDGEIAFAQIRPDEPRYRDGKKIKYEMPRGVRMTFDVHPLARDKLGDPSTPLFVTEGVKKGDAIVTQGLCAISLLGVWNWRGRNERGGKTVLEGWDYAALNDREVYIVFDSDVSLKPEVQAAMLRLKSFLEGR